MHVLFSYADVCIGPICRFGSDQACRRRYEKHGSCVVISIKGKQHLAAIFLRKKKRVGYLLIL